MKLILGIVMIIVGALLALNVFFKWFLKGRTPGEYSIMNIAPDVDSWVRIFLGLAGAVVAVWGAYLIFA